MITETRKQSKTNDIWLQRQLNDKITTITSIKTSNSSKNERIEIDSNIIWLINLIQFAL